MSTFCMVFSGLNLPPDTMSVPGWTNVAQHVLTREQAQAGRLGRMEEALKEIALGRRYFNREPLEHAKNCIESMKMLAKQALSVPTEKTG